LLLTYRDHLDQRAISQATGISLRAIAYKLPAARQASPRSSIASTCYEGTTVNLQTPALTVASVLVPFHQAARGPCESPALPDLPA